MSKQSDAKESQGYTRTPASCGSCECFTSEKTKTDWGYMIEKNMRCTKGGFAVKKTATCNEFKRKG